MAGGTARVRFDTSFDAARLPGDFLQRRVAPLKSLVSSLKFYVSYNAAKVACIAEIRSPDSLWLVPPQKTTPGQKFTQSSEMEQPEAG